MQLAFHFCWTVLLQNSCWKSLIHIRKTKGDSYNAMYQSAAGESIIGLRSGVKTCILSQYSQVMPGDHKTPALEIGPTVLVFLVQGKGPKLHRSHNSCSTCQQLPALLSFRLDPETSFLPRLLFISCYNDLQILFDLPDWTSQRMSLDLFPMTPTHHSFLIRGTKTLSNPLNRSVPKAGVSEPAYFMV